MKRKAESTVTKTNSAPSLPPVLKSTEKGITTALKEKESRTQSLREASNHKIQAQFDELLKAVKKSSGDDLQYLRSIDDRQSPLEQACAESIKTIEWSLNKIKAMDTKSDANKALKKVEAELQSEVSFKYILINLFIYLILQF